MSRPMFPGWAYPYLRRVPLLVWLQSHQCCICGKFTKRRGYHWACERGLL